MLILLHEPPIELSFFFLLFIRYFLHLNFQCYAKSSRYPSPTPPPTPLPTHSHFLALVFPCTEAYKVCKTKGGSLPNDGQLGRLLIHMQLETLAPGVLVSSYCCSIHRVANPFSSLGTFSSSFIGDPVIHPIAECEHPLLCLLGPDIDSQETAISGSFQQNLDSVCNGVSVWRLIMGWIPRNGNF
jgi:hypothetical protein